MKEKFELNPRPADIVGHCKVEYKDPITDKVLEKIEGNNHVFIDQFYVKDLKSLLSCGLLITDGTSPLETSLPVIPGTPIGYGKIDSAAEGIFQGAYRTTDSYVYKIDDEKIENNYVYDFLSSQIPGVIRYIGLHNLGNRPQFLIDRISDMMDNNPFISNIEENTWYVLLSKISETSSYSTYERHYASLPYDICIGIGTTDMNETIQYYSVSNLIYPDIDTSNSITYEGVTYTILASSYFFSMGYDNTNENFIIRCSSIKYLSNNKCLKIIYYWKLNKNLNSIISKSNFFELISVTITNNNIEKQAYYLDRLGLHNWTTSGGAPVNRQIPSSGQSGTSAYLGFIDNNNNFCILTYMNSLGERTNNLFLVKENMTTGTVSEEQLLYTTDGNIVISIQPTLAIYKNYVWIMRYFQSNDINWQNIYKKDQILVSPIYDINNNSFYSYTIDIPIYNAQSGNRYQPKLKKGLGTQFSNSWMSTYNNTKYEINYMPFALTAYRLPLDAPSRPEGAAVTITYNLQIFY